MANTTVFPGLVTLDPISGLVDYVNDIKPYHTKIFETLVEYQWADYINVNIVDVADWNIPIGQTDSINTTIVENSVPTVPVSDQTIVPTSIMEIFDFFIVAPTPTVLTLVSTDVVNDIVYFAGNVVSDFSIGNLIVITSSSSGNDGNYQLLTIGYNATTNQTAITLNALSGTNGTTGSVTIYNTDTTYNFALPIQSAVVGPTVITEPVTGTTFSVSTFTVQGNATRAIQPGSIFQAVATLPPTITPYLYHAAFVQFIPSFNTNGSRNLSGDITVIGVKLDSVFTNAVISSGFLIPYSITGYDNRYDGPYDQMAGYQIISD